MEQVINSSKVMSAEVKSEFASEPTDAELVKVVLAGDEAAFTVIFNRYRRLVAHLAGRFFRQPDEIEDVTQQSFTKLYFSLKDFRGAHEKSLSAWISRITINLCYDELRRRQRRREDVFSALSDEENDFLTQVSENKTPNSEKTFIAKDLVEKLLADLDPKDRLALTLLHGEDFSVAEVAKLVGWSESNVKTRLFRARNMLRNTLNRWL